jgi:DNA-binding NtrC family response regulator
MLPTITALTVDLAAGRTTSRALTEAALARIGQYGWPGNVRELENVLERAAVLCEGREIDVDDLGLPEHLPAPEELVQPVEFEDSHRHDDVMEAIEKRRLLAALKAAGGNQSHAARALGIPRTTLINKMKRYGLI